MDDDLTAVGGTHCPSSCAVSTNSAENTPPNSSRNSSFSVLFCSPSSRPTEYTYKRIEMLMKQYSDRYVIVNNSNQHTSKCWYLFGFPALIESVDENLKIIETFVTCRLCFTHPILSTPTTLISWTKIIRASRQLVFGLFPYQTAWICRQLITKEFSRRMKHQVWPNCQNYKLNGCMQECTSVHRRWQWKLSATSTRMGLNRWVLFCHGTCLLFSD
jgi:hypothetical protein